MADTLGPNQLAGDSSPYLVQHATNPVRWQRWNDQTLELARRLDRPVFLSVGYSSCYWCHVMERQSFENAQVAEMLNEYFVPVKVDREQRPDVDALYMLALQLLTGQGGWPMNLFLTPEGLPFYGGTYFPPDDSMGRAGLPQVLEAMARAWRERRPEVEQTARQVRQTMEQWSTPQTTDAPAGGKAHWADWVDQSLEDYDPEYGGFGRAPKFPRQSLLELLLEAIERRPDRADWRKMLGDTLDAMARGGLRDQLGGAFHRYSTDRLWQVPHFEIMLYDNALLGGLYAQAAAKLGGSLLWTEAAGGALDFFLSDMRHPGGGFYASLDAEVNGREGESYLWTAGQIRAALGDSHPPEQIDLALAAWGLEQGTNFTDPHDPSAVPANVLYLPKTLGNLAQERNLDPSALAAQLEAMRQALLSVRRRRPQPRRDDKIIVAWNGLMIRGLAQAAQALNQPRYLAAASQAAEFLFDNLRRPDGGLWHVRFGDKSEIAGFLEDYAYLAWGLLQLHSAGDDPQNRWLKWARELAGHMLERFADPLSGALYLSQENADGAGRLPLRQVQATDSPLPAANAVAAMVLTQLDQLPAAEKILAAFALQMHSQPAASPALVQARLLLDDRRPVQACLREQNQRWFAQVNIADDYYIYAPAAPPPRAGLQIFDGHDPIAAEYPEPIVLSKELGGDAVYMGQVKIALPAGVLPKVVTLRYQCCGRGTCQPPREVVLSVCDA